ncbi:MAG: glycosyltransferase family 4 protein [Chloroflexi bacterium]|nr:glycosyltransferase family 4 protein [Chloroflexota bacterium]
MRIGLNAHFLKQPNTGSGQYTRNLLAAISALDHGDDYSLIAPYGTAVCDNTQRSGSLLGTNGHSRLTVGRGASADEDHRQGSGRSGAPAFRWREVRTPFDALSRQFGKVWFEQVSVPNACRLERVDVVHYPYFAAPLASPCKVVVTVHDVIPLLLAPYRGSATVRLYSSLVSLAVKRAAAIITDSESSKADIIKVLGIPPERILVVYLAVDERFKVEEDEDVLRRVRLKYGLKRDFILYMGGLDYRKNVVSLVEAFAEVKPRLGSGVQLAIAGQLAGGSSLFPDVAGVVRQLGLDDAVVFLGAVDEADQAALYSAAVVFVFPSLYEGFGLPPLEAMACGAPVICSGSSSLPEVVGDAAIVYEPTKRAELIKALLDVLTDEGLRGELRQRGLKRACRFSWAQTARETMRVYEAVARGRRLGGEDCQACVS